MAAAILILLFTVNARAVTIDEAFKSALSKNESVGQSREQVVQAEERLDQARGAILPSLSLNATHLIQPKPSDPIAAQFFPETQTTVNVSATQPLFRGFREFAALRQRENMVGAEKQTRAGALVSLYERVAAAHVDVLALEQDLKNLEEQRTITGQRVKDLQARTRRGESSATEALTAQSTEAAVEAEIKMVEARLKSAREHFSYLTGLPVDARLTDVEPKRTQAKKIDEYLARVDERPDVKAAKERVSAAEEEVSIARGGHWPSLDVVGNYYLKRPEGFLSDLKWDVQFRFTLPLFEGGTRVSQTQEASSRNREAELELSRLRRQAAADIRSLYESHHARVGQLEALKRSAELAEKNYQTLQRDFRRGLARSIDVQLGLTEYRVMRRTYDSARYQARLDVIRLESAAAILPNAIAKEL
ncbi:MAG TPA: TolC family protein [Bdellovibrionales bacterium]|nr:TolC family protein [Bdellovibrionales bacterium]